MATIITDISKLDLNGTYSYADYLLWHLEERLELIKGKIFKISPAPNVAHQRISTQLQGAFFNYLNSKGCDLFSAPFDVRLYSDKRSKLANKDIYTVVQPDLCIVCDENKLDERGCLGAPDLVVEILSPGNSKKEMNDKFELYEECGVREYWLVEPVENAVFVYVLGEKGTYMGLKPATDILRSTIFPDFEVNLKDVFR